MTRNMDISNTSNRQFGLFFSLFFWCVFIFPLFSGGKIHTWPLGVSVSFLTLALLRPNWLYFLNHFWFLLGRSLHKAISPLVLFVAFFGIITPFSLIMRLFRAGSLQSDIDTKVETYWQIRTTGEAGYDRFKDQF